MPVKRIYMDCGAGVPVDPRVLEAMRPYFTEMYGNPSSVHSFGQEAKKAIENSRKQVTDLISAEIKDEIIFTSGATESNNLAIKGFAYRNKSKGSHIITSTIEHMSVINAFKALQKEGFSATFVPVDEYGVINIEELKKAITDQTTLISVMYANGEIGTIEPIKEIGEIAHEKGIGFHVDAVAAEGQIPINVVNEHIDLLTLSSNDLYGPKGVGALYIKFGTRIQPVTQGGGQEKGLRSGTEDVVSIVGMGKASELMKKEMSSESLRLIALRDKLIKGVLDSIPYSFLNGHPTKRLPNNANLRFSYIEGESLILSLDMEGVYVSSGSACTSKTLDPSHVLLNIGLKHEEAHGSLLFTLGKQITEENIKYVVEVLPGIVKRLRMISPLTPKELRG
jgi:cysteine desulfurase